MANDVYSMLGTGLSSSASFLGQLAANRANREIAEKNRQATIAMNRENIAFQQAENAITREREDNAVQRAAADMQAAGLSKTLAAGSPASAAALAAPSVQAATLNHKEENLMKDINLASTFTGLMQGIAQANKTSEEAKGQAISNEYAEEKARADIDYHKALTFGAIAKEKLDTLEYNLKHEYGGKEYVVRINSMLADIDFTYSNIAVNRKKQEQLAQDITESIARTSKVDQETKKLIEETTLAAIQAKAANYNLDVSQDLSIRTTDSLPTMLGIPVGAGSRGVKKFLDDLFNLPETISNKFGFSINELGKKYLGI